MSTNTTDTIAPAAARLHGGTLSVWSELGRGTNFVLTLPRQGVVGDGALGSPIPVDPGDDDAPVVGEEVGGGREEVLPPRRIGHQRRARQEEGAFLREEERGDRRDRPRGVSEGDHQAERREAVEGGAERWIPL